jgi:hypothetical protein
MKKKSHKFKRNSKNNNDFPLKVYSVCFGEFRVDFATKEGRDLLKEKHILRFDAAEDQIRVVLDGKLYTADGPGDAIPQACQSDAENYMLRFGENWSIRFRGNRPFLMRKRIGLEIIAKLLEAPTREFSYSEFIKVDAFDTQNRRVDHQELRTSETLEQADERGLILRNNEKEELRVLEKTREEAIEAHAPDSDIVIHECTEEINKIMRRAKARCKPPIAPSEKKGAWAVSKAVKAAIASIDGENEELGDHLTECLKTGSSLKYLSAERVDWEIEY